LLPEALSAIRAAARNALQTSLNVALGSAVATIGLTIPAVAVVSLVNGRELIIGLGPRDTVLLLLTLVITAVSFGTGRTNMLTGLVHLVIFATFVFLLVVP
ncbi:MAG: ionic transporter, partial [Rhizobiales bacterium]|nr:ionic transporter [Hyphomicrobiales bacterium]